MAPSKKIKKKRPLAPKSGLIQDHGKREQDHLRHFIEEELEDDHQVTDAGWEDEE
jgi:hypothetical protein